MEYYSLPQTNLKVSKVALGCMRIASKTPEEVENLVLESLKAGINFFDHADIYGGGKSEELFGKVLQKHPELRKEINQNAGFALEFVLIFLKSIF